MSQTFFVDLIKLYKKNMWRLWWITFLPKLWAPQFSWSPPTNCRRFCRRPFVGSPFSHFLHSILTSKKKVRDKKDVEFYALSCGTVGGNQFEFTSPCDTIFGFGGTEIWTESGRHRLVGSFYDLIFDILNSFLTFIGWARKQKDAEFYALSCVQLAENG